MASRWWVGGTGNWTASDTTHWSASSGGAGGASAPTSADDVFFDAGSDAGGIFTVTIGTGAVCRDITASGLDFTMTLAGSAALSIYGSVSYPATNLSMTHTGTVFLLATTSGKTITTNGVTKPNGEVQCAGVGGEWTLTGAFTNASNLNVQQGTFNTANFNLTVGRFIVGASGTVSLGSSTIICTQNGVSAVNINATSTINADTSTITLNQATQEFLGNGKTFYNVSFTSTSAGTSTITGANTFNNLTFTSLAATGIRNISVGANQTVNGTLTLGTANTAIRRMFMRSDTIGTQITITAAAIAALADVDFRDIVAAGASGTWSGTRLGNCLGNSNITFDASKSVYRIGTGNWSATQWALSSGGAVNVNNFPLAQDDCVFDGSTTTGTHTFDADWNIGGIDCTGLTSAVTLNFINGNFNVGWYKNLTFSSFVTTAVLGSIQFFGQGTVQEITSAGVVIAYRVALQSPNGTLKLKDALNITATTDGFSFRQLTGTLDLNGFDLTCHNYNGSATALRSILFGANKIICTGNAVTVVGLSIMTNFSYTGTPVFELTYAGGGGTRIIRCGNSGGTESNAVSINITGGTDIISMAGIHANVDFTGFSGSISNNLNTFYGSVIYSTGMTLTAGTNATTFAKSSGTQTITTNGKTLDFPITKNGNGTLQLQDALTQGSTRTLTHTAGTIDVNDFTLTAWLYSSTGATARQLDVGAGSFVNTGATFTVSGSNYTTAGTGSISMTSASAKTFAGGGFSYPTLNQGGAGDLSVTGANTFANITNTVQPATINLPASTVTNCANVNTAGDATNQLTIQSSSNGVQATINLTAADVDTKYTTFKDIKVTGNYKLNAYTQSGTADSIGNVNNGNNSNITFTPTGGLFMVVM